MYGIIKQSGGNIWVYSEPGKGATFKVYLPRVDAGVARSHARGSAPRSARGGQVVLLVEDDGKVREVVSVALREAGYIVLEADGGRGCPRPPRRPRRARGPPDRGPRDAGYERARSRGALARGHPETRTLFMSGYTDTTAYRQGDLPAGADFIQKPFAPSALARKVREVLERPAAR